MIVADWGQSVVVGAAEVVATVGADELAVVAGEAMAASGADLAVVVDLRSLGMRSQGGRVELRKIAARIGASEADRTTL